MIELSVEANGLSAMCRVCLTADATLVNLFAYSVKLKARVVDTFQACTSVQVTKNDNVPSYICKRCCDELKKFQEFRARSIRSDSILRRYLSSLKDFGNYKDKRSNNLASKTKIEQVFIKEEPDDDFENESLLEAEIFDSSFESQGPLQSTVDSEFNLLRKVLTSKTSSEYRCQTCSNCFKSSTVLNHHKCVHTGEQLSYHCSACNNWFETGSSLNSHTCICTDDKLIHTSEKLSYLCPVCNNWFETGSSLNNHKCIRDGDKLLHTAEKPYLCAACNNCFETASSLNRHNCMHAGEKLLHTGERLTYRCVTCNEQFASASDHECIHTPDKPDSIDKIIPSNVKLNKDKTPIYYCKICSESFFLFKDLNSHNRWHTGDKPFACVSCQKRFKTSTGLTIHKRTHTGEKPYRCDVCHKCFGDQSTMKRHTLIHTGAKPHGCNVCGKCFRDKSTLKKHLKLHSLIA